MGKFEYKSNELKHKQLNVISPELTKCAMVIRIPNKHHEGSFNALPLTNKATTRCLHAQKQNPSSIGLNGGLLFRLGVLPSGLLPLLGVHVARALE